ncbi:glycosyltransferase family 2 protein [Carnobacterium inhibens]|uniref:glycosyltransferase family 2 protein n=1 Tax=Carnobacterium inhibens TaxID=147709 RepID=UPI0005588C6A|nr:glycosyltransferase family 2 protein [Carnobacterium inhibens]
MLLSVIMPVYNVEKTLSRAIESILNQSFSNLELILVNDGSTDKSSEICEEYALKDKRISIINKINGGLSSARNEGLKNTKGDFVTFIDSDDYLDLNTYQLFYEKLLKEKIDLYIFNVCRIRNNKEEILDSIEKKVEGSEEIIKSFFMYKGIDFYAWNKIYKKELFDGLIYPENTLYEDIVTSYRVVQRAQKAYVTDKVGYYYIDNPESIVNSQFNPKQYDNVSQREILLNNILKDYPNLSLYALDKLLDGFLSTGYKIGSSIKNETTSKYLKLIRKDIAENKKLMKKNPLSSKAKLIALKLLEVNINVYTFLYRKVLKK